MARNNRHNAAFVVGSVIGAVAGAAVALWKTPYTGEELRSKLSSAGASEGGETRTYTASSTGVVAGEERSVKDKVLSGVEKTLAPIVGVELGKTANGSRATPMDSGDIKVNPDHGATRIRKPRAWTDGGATASSADAGEDKIGLSMDKVDAEKWAAAYGTAGAAASAPEPTRPETTAEPKKEAEAVSPEYGTTRLRRVNAWKGGGETAATSGSGSETIGLSMDKVDAEEWASAYGTQAGAASTSTSSTTSTQGTQSSSGASNRGQQAANAAESEAQTGLGAQPAFPGEDAVGHQPANRTAPDSNVGQVSHNADDAGVRDTNLAVENAASVDDLTTPQVDLVPDSQQLQAQGGYHPFPKLGGKED